MNSSIKWELFRKFIHLAALAIPVGYYFMSQGKVILILAPLTAIFIFVDILKAKSKTCRKWIDKNLGFILRGHERRGAFSGASYILFGALFSIVIFPKMIAILVITFTVAGDLCAALAGKVIGQHKLIGRTTVEGSIAFLAASLIATSFYPGVPSSMRLVGALFATLVEMLPLKIDDNLTIPILTGTVLAILAKFIPTW